MKKWSFFRSPHPQPHQSLHPLLSEACRFWRISTGIVELWGIHYLTTWTLPFKPKSKSYNQTSNQTFITCSVPDIGWYLSWSSNAICNLLSKTHKRRSCRVGAPQSLDITLVTQCMQPFTLCQAIDKPHVFLYLDTGNKKGLLIPKLEFDQLVRKVNEGFM